jgi:hypothetical protein
MDCRDRSDLNVDVVIATLNHAILRLVLFWRTPYSYHVATFAVDLSKVVQNRRVRYPCGDVSTGVLVALI